MKAFVTALLLTLLCHELMAASPAPTYKCVNEVAGGISESNEIVDFSVPFEWRVVPFEDALPLLKSKADQIVILQELIGLTQGLSADALEAYESKSVEKMTTFLLASDRKPYLLRRTSDDPSVLYSYQPCSVYHSGAADALCTGLNMGQKFILGADRTKFWVSVLGGYVDGTGASLLAKGSCTKFYD